MAICAIMQPTYLPWMGYFSLIFQSDYFVFYDDVQLVKRSWGTRNRIKTSQGELLLTIPIIKTLQRDDTTLMTAKIQYEEKWTKKHLMAIKQNYNKTPHFEEIYNLIEDCLLQKHEFLADLNIDIIKKISQKLGYTTTFLKSSELESKDGVKDSRLVAICKELNCDSYLSPQGSSAYIEEEKAGGVFPENNISLYYQNFEHPIYIQKHGDFISHLAILDCLFNCGFEETKKLIQEGSKPPIDYLTFRKEFLSLS